MEIAEPQAFWAQNGLAFRGRWLRATVVGVVSQQIGSGAFLVPIEQARLARQWALAGIDGGDVFPLPSSPFSGLIVLASILNDLHAARQVVTGLGYANSAPEQPPARPQGGGGRGMKARSIAGRVARRLHARGMHVASHHHTYRRRPARAGRLRGHRRERNLRRGRR